MPPSKTCRVCGDKAAGFNFNVISCESCKAFFRRNAGIKKQLKCPFKNECVINIETRRVCKKCRYDKCVAVGMVKEYKAEEKLSINGKFSLMEMNTFENDRNVPESIPHQINSAFGSQSTSTNSKQTTQYVNLRPQARVTAMCNQPDLSAATESIPMPLDVKFEHTFGNNSISVDKVMRADSNWQNLNSSEAIMNINSFNAVDLHQQLHNDFTGNYFSSMYANHCANICNQMKKKSSEQENGEVCSVGSGVNISISRKSWVSCNEKEVLNLAVSAEYSDLAKRVGLQYSGSNLLTAIETQKIKELVVANPRNSLQLTPDDDVILRKINKLNVFNILTIMDLSLRNVIKFSKKISAFQQLCEDDQISLVKGSCTEITTMNSAMAYNSVRDAYDVNGVAYFNMDMLKEVADQVYQENKQLVQLDWAWKNDETIILIISAIILFTPTRPNIVHTEIIEKELHSYYFLLQRYLESKYPKCDAKVMFMKLIQIVQELKKVNKDLFRLLSRLNPAYVEPLLAEVFDFP